MNELVFSLLYLYFQCMIRKSKRESIVYFFIFPNPLFAYHFHCIVKDFFEKFSIVHKKFDKK